MPHPTHDKRIAWFVVFSLITNVALGLLGVMLFPPDFSKEFPVYHPTGIMLLEYGGALLMAALTVIGQKLGDEKKILPAAGFTMLAIATGILMASMFEISSIVSLETYEKFYRIQASANFLLVPAMYLISEYEDFKKWVRYIGLLSTIPLLGAGFMFLAGNRDFRLLESISNIGFALLFVTELSWAYNFYSNYRQSLTQAR